MKFLIDLDLLLDAILNRQLFSYDAKLLWGKIESKAIEGYVTETGLDKIISIVGSLTNSEQEANEVIDLVQATIKIAYVNSQKLQLARKLPLKDFDAALELVCAEAYDVLAVVTDQPEKFEGLQGYPVPVWTVDKVLDMTNSEIIISSAYIHPSTPIASETPRQSDSSKLLYFDIYNYLIENSYISKPFTPTTCPIDSQIKSNLPITSSQQLIWKENTLRQVFQFLQTDKSVRSIAICGEVGVGKSSLALQIAQVCEESRTLGEYSSLPAYDAIIFVPTIWYRSIDIPSNSSKSFAGNYLRYLIRTIATGLGDDSINRTSDKERFKRVYECLRRQKTLLILDGLDYFDNNYGEIEDFLEHLPNSTKVVITSRQNQLDCPSINLERLDDDSIFSIIKNTAEKKNLILREDEIVQIYRHCLGNPLVVKIAMLQHTNFLGSIAWEKVSNIEMSSILQFLGITLFNSLKSKCARDLLMLLALARNSYDLEVLIEFSSKEKINVSKLKSSLAELLRLSLIFEDGTRYSLNPIIRELVLLVIQQPPFGTRRLYERLLNSYLALAEKYGGTDWGDWHVNYDFLNSEWENLQSVLQWCIDNDRYESFKQLWKSLNHFADLYGYWSDRLLWLGWLIQLSKKNNDWKTHVFALSRKAWTLIMIDQPNSLAEAEQLLNIAYENYHEADIEAQSYLMHHRSVFYIRSRRYEEAEKALNDQQKILAELKINCFDQRTLMRHQLNFLRNRAKLDMKQGRLGLARKRYEIVLKRATTINWLRGVCYAHNKLADIALLEKNLEAAEKHLTSGLPIAKQNRNKRRLAEYEQSFAQLATLQGDKNTAKQWADLAKNHYKRIGMENESRKLEATYG